MTLAMELKRRELTSFAEGEKNGREKEGNHDDIGNAAEGLFRREYCRVRENLGRIHYGIRKKTSFIVIRIRRLLEQASFFVRYDREF